MATLTGADFITIMNLSDDTSFDAETAEEILDAAINKLNRYLYRYGLEISNLTGTAGSKTLTLEGREKDAVLTIASLIYLKNYKTSGSQSESASLGPASMSTSMSTTSMNVEETARQVADELRDHDIEVSYG
jgi:hypothetical protein